MKKFINDYREAFREGILDASTNSAKILRWIGLILLWSLSLACIFLGIWASIDGYGFQGAIIMLHSITFGFISVTPVFLSSTSEIQKRW